MTGSAVIHDACMIKDPGYKARGYVAHMTVIAGWNMVRGRCFARGRGAIVARRTVINDALVIETGTGKGLGVMAHGAILSCRQMVL